MNIEEHPKIAAFHSYLADRIKEKEQLREQYRNNRQDRIGEILKTEVAELRVILSEFERRVCK